MQIIKCLSIHSILIRSFSNFINNKLNYKLYPLNFGPNSFQTSYFCFFLIQSFCALSYYRFSFSIQNEVVSMKSHNTKKVRGCNLKEMEIR